VVMKFGGSSLADETRIDHVAQLIKDQNDVYNIRPRAVVCSAMGKTTNNLLSAGDFALGRCLYRRKNANRGFSLNKICLSSSINFQREESMWMPFGRFIRPPWIILASPITSRAK
jgi:Amino acid kinase family